MEVAGLVLGAIPLAIHALQEYRLFFSSFKNAQKHIASIIRRLQAQQRILENTCNVLLTGIAPPSEIEAFIQTPFNSSWNKHEEQIRLRLGQDWNIFNETVGEMQNAVKTLQGKLAIGDDGKVSSSIAHCLLLRSVQLSHVH